MLQTARHASLHNSRAILVSCCLFWLLLTPYLLSFVPTSVRTVESAATWEESDQSSAMLTTNPVITGQRRSQLDRYGASAWHTAGYRGKGVRVAILDSGFHGYRDHLGKALPAHVLAKSFRFDGNLEARDSEHGILCGEVVHAMAPEAELLFANWEPQHPEQFLKAIRWAREQGARIISCSCIMPEWSDGEGGGAIHAELSRLLGSGAGRADLLCFASAGNTAQRHWAGSFQFGTNGCHQWQTGQIDNLLTPWSQEEASVQLYSPAGANYELHVYDRTTGTDVAKSTTSSAKDRCTTSARFLPQPGHKYYARVRLVSGTPGRFHLVALHSDLQFATVGGSICFPADGRDVIAVGAVTSQGLRCSYSACGPNSSRPKPDLVAAVPFTSLWRERPFAGTSAAAPQAAALAALCWSRHGDWSASQVRGTLQSSARDLETRGHDFQTGYGLVRLP